MSNHVKFFIYTSVLDIWKCIEIMPIATLQIPDTAKY